MIKDIIMRKQQGGGRASKLTLCCPKPARVKRGAEGARHVQRLNAGLDLYT
jgi:hypothetical protein